MSDTADAIRDREEAKRPKPEKKRGRKAVKGNTEGRTPDTEQAEAHAEKVSIPYGTSAEKRQWPDS